MAQTIRDVYELQGRASTAELNNLIGTLDDLGGAIADMDRDGRRAADGAGVAEGALSRLADATIIAQGAMSALAGVAGIVGGAFAGSVGAMLEQEDALRRFQAATGATEQQMALFEDSADRVFSGGWGEDFGSVLDTMQQVNTITGETGHSLERLTRGATIMGDLWGVDVTEGVRAAETASDAFNISNQRALDTLAAGLQRTGDPAGDLADTFNEYSGNFAQMGFGANQFLDILNQGLEAGARNTDDVADAFREFQIRLMDGTSAEAINQLGPDVIALRNEFQRGEASAAEMSDGILAALRAIEDPVQRNAAGVEIFGTKWEDMGEDVLLGIDPINEAADSMAELDGTLDAAGKTLQDGIGPAWRRFTRVVQTGMMDSLEPLGPFLNNTLTPALEGFGGWLSSEGVPALVNFSGALVDNADFALTNFGRGLDKLQAGNLKGFMASFRTGFDALGSLDIGAQLTSVITEPIKAWFAGVDWGGLLDSGVTMGREWLGRLIGQGVDYAGEVWTRFGSPVVAAISEIDWANEIGAGDGSFIRTVLGKLLGGGGGEGRTAAGENSGGQFGTWVNTHIAAPIGTAISGIAWGDLLTATGTFIQDVLDVLMGETLPDLAAWANTNIGQPVMDAVTGIEWGALAGEGVGLTNRILNALIGDGDSESGFSAQEWVATNIGQPIGSAIAGIDWAALFTGGANILAGMLDGLTASVQSMGSEDGEGMAIDMSWLKNALTAGVANMWGEDGALAWVNTNVIQPIWAGLMGADYSTLGSSLAGFGAAVGGSLVDSLPDWGTWVMESIINPIVEGLKALPARIKGGINEAIPDSVTFEIPAGEIPGTARIPGGPWTIGGGSINLGPIPDPFPDVGDFATGGSFMVPNGGAPIPGSTDQKFAIGLTPGERVDVTPRGGTRGGGGGVIRQPVQLQINGRTMVDTIIEVDSDSATPRFS